MVVVVGSGTLTEQDIRVMGDSEGEFSGFGLMKEHMFWYDMYYAGGRPSDSGEETCGRQIGGGRRPSLIKCST